MSVIVTIIGGPHDGAEMEAHDERLHIAEMNQTPWLATTEEIGPSVHEVVIPVRLTRNGYRAYWYERK